MSQPPLQKLGKYEIRGELGKGAMGVVYRAWDPILEREVAIKVMASAIVSDDELKQRFEREAKAVAKLQHPNIVTVYDLGYDQQGAPYIAMELLKGMDLENLMRTKPPSLVEKLEIIMQVCRGLGHAHANAIVHRDIKPANIFVTEARDVKIMDFGVARWTQSSQTQTGAVLGTADYMSPEQIRGHRVDGRSDIFAVGVILYRLLTKKKPFRGDNIQAVFFKILNADPPDLLLPDGSQVPELQAIVDRALAKETAERYAKAEEMAEEIKEFLRRYHGALREDTVFDTAFDPGAAVEHDSSGRMRRATFRPGTGPGPTAPVGASRTYRPTGGTVVTPTAASPAAGRTIAVPTARPAPGLPATALPATRLVTRPGVAVAVAPPRKTPWLLVGGIVLALAAAGGGVYLYVSNRPEATTTTDLTSRFEFAEEALDKGRLAQASEAVENILSLSPGNPRALELREKIKQALEAQNVPPPPATSTIPRQTPTRPEPSNREQAQGLVADAGMALGMGDVNRARELISQGERLDPSNPRWAQLRQQLAQRQKDLERQSLEQTRAQVVAGYLKQATDFIAAKDYDRAIESYDNVLKHDPANASALAGKGQALTLKQQLELEQRRRAEEQQQQQQPSVPATRNIIESGTEYIAAAGRDEGPKGFEAGGGVEVKRATTAAKFPAQLSIEVNPPTAQPGNPYLLRIRIYNEGNTTIQVKSLEVVSTYGGKTTGKGQPIPPKTQRINPKQTVLLHEVPGTWSEEQNQGSITATVTLVGDARLTKTIRW